MSRDSFSSTFCASALLSLETSAFPLAALRRAVVLSISALIASIMEETFDCTDDDIARDEVGCDGCDSDCVDKVSGVFAVA